MMVKEAKCVSGQQRGKDMEDADRRLGQTGFFTVAYGGMAIYLIWIMQQLFSERSIQATDLNRVRSHRFAPRLELLAHVQD